MTASINYQRPGQRSEIGKWNDSAYETSREALQGYLETPRLAEAFRRLHEQQMDVGFIQDDLTLVERFQCRSDDGDDRVTFIGQFNPRRRERSKGAGRKTPPRGVQTVETTDSSCFLCTDNFCTELEDQLIKEQKINFLHMWRVLESVHPPQCADVDWAAALGENGPADER